MSSIASFVLEIAFPAASPHACYVIFLHDILEHLELAGSVERDEVHTPIPAEVAPIEPVPVLKLVPGLTPGEEIVVLSNFHV